MNSVGATDGDQPISLHETHLRFAEAQQSYISSYIQLADTKSAWVFAASAALIGFLLTNADISPILSVEAGSVARPLGAISFVFLLASSITAFLGIAPRLRSTKPRDPFFFATVASFETANRYVEELSEHSFESLVRARLYHNYDIAKICLRKYRNIRLSLWLGFLGAAILGLALAVPAFRDNFVDPQKPDVFAFSEQGNKPSIAPSCVSHERKNTIDGSAP